MVLAFDLVGWGTLTLAAATAAMAVATFMVIKQARRTADAAEEDLRQGNALLKASQEQVLASQGQVAAAQEQARAAGEALAVSVRPLLVAADDAKDVPNPSVVWSFEANGLTTGEVDPPLVANWLRTQHAGGPVQIHWVVVKIRNIGNGPALIDRQAKWPFLRTMYGSDVPGSVTSLVVAPHESAYLAFADTKTEADDGTSLASMLRISEDNPNYPHHLTVVVRYADVGRERWTTSHLKFHPHDKGRLELIGIEIDPDEP